MAFASAKLTFYIKLSFVEIAKKAEVGIAAGRDSARNIYHPLVNLMEKISVVEEEKEVEMNVATQWQWTAFGKRIESSWKLPKAWSFDLRWTPLGQRSCLCCFPFIKKAITRTIPPKNNTAIKQSQMTVNSTESRFSDFSFDSVKTPKKPHRKVPVHSLL